MFIPVIALRPILRRRAWGKPSRAVEDGSEFSAAGGPQPDLTQELWRVDHTSELVPPWSKGAGFLVYVSVSHWPKFS